MSYEKAHITMHTTGEIDSKDCIVDILADKKLCFRCKTAKNLDSPVYQLGLCKKCFVAKDPEFERNRKQKKVIIGTNEKIRYKGQSKLLKEWAKEYNMSICTLMNRLYRSMTIHEALTTPVQERNKSRKTGIYKGETKTLVEWSKQMGFSRDVVRNRIKHGWTLKKAIETPVRPRKRNK